MLRHNMPQVNVLIGKSRNVNQVLSKSYVSSVVKEMNTKCI